MKPRFNLGGISTVEFGVGIEDADSTGFFFVPVDAEVQEALLDMVTTTVESLTGLGEPAVYDPADKHRAIEHLRIPLDEDVASVLRDLHEAANLQADAHALDDVSEMFCYFARLSDADGRTLTAVRRATQFKGTVGKRLIRFRTDALRLIKTNVFKLDVDFDLLIDERSVHVLRPSGFEVLAKARDAIVSAAKANVDAIAGEMKFVDLSGIAAYAKRHPRAARLLASIRATGNARNVSQKALRRLCKENGVGVRLANGHVTIEDGQELAFLEVLDRRRYELELVEGTPERYRAASREPVRK